MPYSQSVLLTALDSIEYNIEGFQQGADDYISKPFHAKVLLMRCNNLIRNRLLLKSRLTKQVDFDVQLLATTSLDQQLLNRLRRSSICGWENRTLMSMLLPAS